MFGVNDGLVSNAALIYGVAGAAQEPSIILLTGVAGLLAGAFSMAAGEYVSVRSQREMFEYQIGLERDELETYPDEEAAELALIYAAKGMDPAEARRLADTLMQDPERALDTLAREELGLNPDELGSPWVAAISSFAAFTAGAALPLLPFLFGHGQRADRLDRAHRARPVRRRRQHEPVHRPPRPALRPAHARHRRRGGTGDVFHRRLAGGDAGVRAKAQACFVYEKSQMQTLIGCSLGPTS